MKAVEALTLAVVLQEAERGPKRPTPTMAGLALERAPGSEEETAVQEPSGTTVAAPEMVPEGEMSFPQPEIWALWSGVP